MLKTSQSITQIYLQDYIFQKPIYDLETFFGLVESGSNFWKDTF